MNDLMKGLGRVCLGSLAGAGLVATSLVAIEALMPKTAQADERRFQPCQYNGGKWVQVQVSSDPFHLKWDDGPQMTYTWVASVADRWNLTDKLGGRWNYSDHRTFGGFTLTNIDNGNRIKCVTTKA